MSVRSLSVAFFSAIFFLPASISTAGATDDDAGRNIEQQLRTPIDVDFRDRPANEALDVLCGAAKIHLVIDYVALAKYDIDLGHPISLQLDQVALTSALKLVLDKAHATYCIEGGVVRVTAKEALRGPLVLRFYWVHDLVTLATKKEESQHVDLKSKVAEFMRDTIEPRSWASNGGNGKLGFVPLTGILVVLQTSEVQEQVDELLAALRRISEAWHQPSRPVITPSKKEPPRTGECPPLPPLPESTVPPKPGI